MTMWQVIVTYFKLILCTERVSVPRDNLFSEGLWTCLEIIDCVWICGAICAVAVYPSFKLA